MSNEDRYHTTSWDGGQVRRQAAAGGAPSQPNRASGGSGKKKAKKRSGPIRFWRCFSGS